MADDVNHPSHYNAYQGLEIIDLTEQMNFNRGNAVKYIARAGLKNPATEVEDLKKALWYVRREIDRLEKRTGSFVEVRDGYGNLIQTPIEYRPPRPEEVFKV